MAVAIIHPWLPEYRLPFFEALVPLAAERGIRVDVFYGATPPEWADRGDSVQSELARELPTRFIRMGGKNLILRSTRHVRGGYDVLVLEQAVRNLETYGLLLGKTPIAFWGHGRTYTARPSPAQEKLKQIITKRAKWFFAYTDAGAKAVADYGFPSDKITVVRNATDTTELRSSLQRVSEIELANFRAEHGLRGPVALYMGGIDASKRIEFLLDAARAVAAEIPDFRLLVAGDGDQRQEVLSAQEKSDSIVYLGKVSGDGKARALAAADVLAIPGRVGLVAVDSFASGVPIVTTNWPYHAPEFDYLDPQSDCAVTEDDVISYARGLTSLLSDPTRLAAMRAAALAKSDHFNIESMAENFVDGLIRFQRSAAVVR